MKLRLSSPRQSSLFLAEIVLILLVCLIRDQKYLDFNPSLFLDGDEPEWNVHPMAYQLQVFQETGRLPHWLPYIGFGEPAIDNGLSFLFNPFSSIPMMALGMTQGIKVSVFLYTVLAGLGGWFLGWTMGWGSLARLACGVLIAMKGGMDLTFGLGYFQLAAQQAFFPWVMAGAVGMARFPNKRYPIILLALALALTLHAGNVYYILPAAIIAGLVAIFQIVTIEWDSLNVRFNSQIVMRYLLATILAFALMAVIAVPVAANYWLFSHPSHDPIHDEVDVIRVLAQFFNPQQDMRTGVWVENYYTYTIPLWFFVLIFIVLLPIGIGFQRSRFQGSSRVLAAAILGFFIFLVWGLGLDFFVNTLYELVPLLGQWRTVQRMLPVATFLAIFIICYRIDFLWLVLFTLKLEMKRGKLLRRVVLGGAAFLTVFAIAEIAISREMGDSLRNQFDPDFDECLIWLRAQYPEELPAVYTSDNDYVFSHLYNRVRMPNVLADYDYRGVPSDLYPHDLTEQSSEYAFIPPWRDDPEYWRNLGYEPVPEAPLYPSMRGGIPCFHRNNNALPYSFGINAANFEDLPYPLTREYVQPLTVESYQPEHIVIIANATLDDELVVVASEIAYPGWVAHIDGQPAAIESFGELLSVRIPPGEGSHLVEFTYTAPYLRLGGLITLIAGIVCIGYLLRVDTVPQRIHRWFSRNRSDKRD